VVGLHVDLPSRTKNGFHYSAEVAGRRSWIVGATGIVWRIPPFLWRKDIRRSFSHHVHPVLSWEEPEEYGHVRRKTDSAMINGKIRRISLCLIDIPAFPARLVEVPN